MSDTRLPAAAPPTGVYAGLTDVVLAVADARPDLATQRFDAELAAAVTAGRLDDATARTLRWWQRESLRGMRSYLADVLPSILATLDAAADGSAASVEQSAAAWTRAGAATSDSETMSAPVAAESKPVEAAQAATPLPATPTQTTRTTAAGTTTSVRRPLDLGSDPAERRRREVVAGLVAAESMSNGHGPNAGREGRR